MVTQTSTWQRSWVWVSPPPVIRKLPRAWPVKKESCPHAKKSVEDIIKKIKCALSNSLIFSSFISNTHFTRVRRPIILVQAKQVAVKIGDRAQRNSGLLGHMCKKSILFFQLNKKNLFYVINFFYIKNSKLKIISDTRLF